MKMTEDTVRQKPTVALLKRMLKKTPVGVAISARRQHFYNRFCQLSAKGKHRTIQEYGARYGIRTLIETRTYLGDTLQANAGNFDRLIPLS